MSLLEVRDLTTHFFTRAGVTEPRIDVNAARLYLLSPPNATKTFTFNTAAQAAQWTPFVGTWSVNTAAMALST